MAVYYFDTSASVKRYISETGSGWIRARLDPTAGNDAYVLRLTELESASAFIRRSRGGTLSSADATTALADLQHDFLHQYQVVQIDITRINHALTLITKYALRTYDALQLADALRLQSQRTALGLHSLTFVCAGQELNSAASAEGLVVDDPNSHP